MELIQPLDFIAYLCTLACRQSLRVAWFMFCAPLLIAKRSLRFVVESTAAITSGVMGEVVTPPTAVTSIHSLDEPSVSPQSMLRSMLPRWVPASMQALAKAEEALFANVSNVIRGRYVPIDDGQSHMWTVSLNTENKEANYPLVLVHGFAGGVGLWSQNYDALAAKRTVHAFDLLGFARSSRSKFATDATLAELRWVKSMEEWRREMGIDKMILCGHSLGGYLSAAYALQYPERVRHLVLVDPWGMPDKATVDGQSTDRTMRLPVWVRSLARVLSLFNPLATVRVAGPWGHSLVKRVRPDFGRRFKSDAIYDYIYHANAAGHPSGESAFTSISKVFGWAKRPMGDRLTALDTRVPLTFIFGQKSWIDSTTGFDLVNRLPENYVNVETVKGAGHHVYADEATAFNECLNDTCEMVDRNEDRFTNSAQI